MSDCVNLVAVGVFKPSYIEDRARDFVTKRSLRVPFNEMLNSDAVSVQILISETSE